MTEIMKKDKKLDGQAMYMFSKSQSRSYPKWPTVAIHSTFDAYCLLDKIVEILQRCFYTFADPL